MKIALATHSLAGIGGVEAYVTTIGDQLQRLGHDVTIYSPEGGASAEIADSLGLRVVRDVGELPGDLEIALPQDAVAAFDLAAARPRLAQVFVAHSDSFDLALPPQQPGPVRCIVTLYERAHRRIAAMALQPPIVRLAQPVDVERFKSRAPLREPPRVALSLGNYLNGARGELVAAGCERAGVEFRHVGTHGAGGTRVPEDVINEADIVFGKARVIHEAMACGRAAYVLDHNGSEGWVTPDNFEQLAADNFGGQVAPRPITAESLAADLDNYSATMGVTNRDLVVARHSAVRHAAELVDVLRRYADAGGEAAPADYAFELARMARTSWRHEAQAFRLTAQLDQARLRIGDLERAQAELEEERTARENAERELERIVHSRRWRAIQALQRPFRPLLDAVRRGR